MPVAGIKEIVSRLLSLMNRLSSLASRFNDENNGKVSGDEIEILNVWGKVKDKYERLFILDQQIDIQEENLKDDIDEGVKNIIRPRLERNIEDANRTIKASIRVEKEAEQYLINKTAEFSKLKAEKKAEEILEEKKPEPKKITPKTIPEKRPIQPKRKPVSQIETKPKPEPKTSKVPARDTDFNSVFEESQKLTREYEIKNIRNISKNAGEIKKLYTESINEISLNASTITLKEGTFKLSKYPKLAAVVNREIKKLHGGIYTTIINSIKESWDLSNEKNNLIVDKRLAGKTPSKKGREILYDPNKPALEQFLKRKERGLNLSDRVWNSLEPFKTQLEGGLAVGISEGKPAAEMAKDLKQYLNNPDKLFRRVRDAKGNLKLSKAAREFHPGQGVYRSSYKNALRLTITETNMSYRASDHERWQGLGFITGIEVKLSNRHPKYDICDEVKGKYPKDFKFVGWHPHCLCFAVPVQMSEEQYDKYEDAILNGDPLPTVSGITDVPKGFTNYVSQNTERIKGYKNTPYWVKDNKDFVNL